MADILARGDSADDAATDQTAGALALGGELREEFALDYAAAAKFVRDGDPAALLQRLHEHAAREAARTIAELEARRK